MAQALPIFPSFDPNPDVGDTAVRWERWVSRFKNLLVALNITNDARQHALLLHYAGEAVNDIYDTLEDTTPGAGEKALDKAIQALTAHFKPQENREWEILKFRRAKQEKDEDLASFCTRLRRLSVTCNFADANREIKSQIIERCSDSKLRLKLLDHSKRDWTLEQVIAAGRAMELSKLQAADMEQALKLEEASSINKMSSSSGRSAAQSKSPRRQTRGHKNKQSSSDNNNNNLCRRCGYKWPHADGRMSCPAYGQVCRKCNKKKSLSAMLSQ